MIQEILGQLGFDYKVALANLVNFLIIYFLLRNVVFKKIGEAIRDRQQKIQQGLEDAKKAEGALVMAEVEKEEILKDAHIKSRQIIEKAELDRQKTIKESQIQAEKEAEEIREKGKIDSAKYIEQANNALKNEYVDIVIDGIEKTALQKIDKASSEKFIKALIN